MNKFKLFSSLLVLLFIFGFTAAIKAQSKPVLYFCERYDDVTGEIGVSDAFTAGYLTVMVKCSYSLELRDVYIKFQKYNCRTGDFEDYKQFSYSVEPDMSYIYFERNSSSDMSFDAPGIYRVFLLDEKKNTVASALIEII